MEVKIKLKNIQLFGYHGVNDFERQNGQPFEIDVEVIAPHKFDTVADDLSKSIDYSVLYDHIVNLFSENNNNLLETLANKISISILNKFKVTSCKITIRKPNVPINGKLDSVEVEVNNNA